MRYSRSCAARSWRRRACLSAALSSWRSGRLAGRCGLSVSHALFVRLPAGGGCLPGACLHWQRGQAGCVASSQAGGPRAAAPKLAGRASCASHRPPPPACWAAQIPREPQQQPGQPGTPLIVAIPRPLTHPNLPVPGLPPVFPEQLEATTTVREDAGGLAEGQSGGRQSRRRSCRPSLVVARLLLPRPPSLTRPSLEPCICLPAGGYGAYGQTLAGYGAYGQSLAGYGAYGNRRRLSMWASNRRALKAAGEPVSSSSTGLPAAFGCLLRAPAPAPYRPLIAWHGGSPALLAAADHDFNCLLTFRRPPLTFPLAPRSRLRSLRPVSGWLRRVRAVPRGLRRLQLSASSHRPTARLMAGSLRAD